jgi:NSS family neurotransmitter:Na+ symporter
MPFGSIFGIAFFLMAFFAALTSSISLLEVATAWADGDVDLSPEERKHKRRIGALVLGLIAFVIGVAHALSVVPASEGNFFFNTWHPADGLPLFEGDTLLDFTDKLTGSVLLPFGGLMTALFAGWAVSSTASREELGFSSDGWYRAWRFLVRWVCPILVGLVLVWGAFVSPIIAARQAPAQSEAADVIEEMARPQG